MTKSVMNSLEICSHSAQSITQGVLFYACKNGWTSEPSVRSQDSRHRDGTHQIWKGKKWNVWFTTLFHTQGLNGVSGPHPDEIQRAPSTLEARTSTQTFDISTASVMHTFSICLLMVSGSGSQSGEFCHHCDRSAGRAAGAEWDRIQMQTRTCRM